MPSDLEANLILGGISPAAAKMISNAISNLASPKTSTGRQLEDATPTKSMRLIDSDTRRYVLTNLDYPASKTSPSSRYSPKGQDHPYANSQPASSSPTLNTPGVTAGKFVSVSSGTQNDVSQSEVSLNVQNMGGQHARMNPATGSIESVPISVVFEPEGILKGEVVEQSGKTVIKISIVSNALRGLLKKRIGAYTSITTEYGGKGTLSVDNGSVATGEVFFLVPE